MWRAVPTRPWKKGMTYEEFGRVLLQMGGGGGADGGGDGGGGGGGPPPPPPASGIVAGPDIPFLSFSLRHGGQREEA